MTKNTLQKRTLFILSSLASISVGLIAALLTDWWFQYNPFVIFSIVITSVGLVLSLYQIIFVNMIVKAQFVTAEAKELAQFVETFHRYVEADFESRREMAEELEQLGSEMSDIVDEVETHGGIPEEEAQKTRELVDEIVENRRNR